MECAVVYKLLVCHYLISPLKLTLHLRSPFFSSFHLCVSHGSVFKNTNTPHFSTWTGGILWLTFFAFDKTMSDYYLVRYLVIEERGQDVVEHLLMIDGSKGTRHRWNQPDPIRWTTSTQTNLCLQMLHEGLACGMVICDGDLIFLHRNIST